MVPREEYCRRLARVTEAMRKHGIDCLLLNQRDNVRYLTGANNTCSWVFLKQDGRIVALVLESDCYDYRKQSIVEDLRVFRTHDPLALFRQLADELDLKQGSLALEKEHLRYYHFEMVKEIFGPRLRLDVDAGYVAQEAEIVKTPEEIECLRTASRLAALGMQAARAYAARGLSEEDVAAHVLGEMRRKGADGASYLYVAAGDRSSLAHGFATQHELDSGPVAIDIHAGYRGYHADMARTVLLPGFTAEQAAMYDHLQEKIGEAISSVTDGLPMIEFRKRFYGSLRLREGWIALSGPLMHGVGYMNAGLPKFEYPYHNTGYPEKIQENMVLAVSNLGLCSRDGWGVRFEETFLVTKGAPVVLTREQ